MKNSVELSIVMPCLNEAESVEACISAARRFLAESRTAGEIIVGDNGSIDGSIEIATRCGGRVVNITKAGYGEALKGGIRASYGKFVVIADSDGSYDFEHLTPFLDRLREGYDLVVGNRFAGGIALGAMPWKNQYIGNPILSGIARLCFPTEARDFHCGLRAFSREAFERMGLQSSGMEFASEMVIKAVRAKMRITEVPTTLSVALRTRPSHLRPWRDGLRHLYVIFTNLF